MQPPVKRNTLWLDSTSPMRRLLAFVAHESASALIGEVFMQILKTGLLFLASLGVSSVLGVFSWPVAIAVFAFSLLAVGLDRLLARANSYGLDYYNAAKFNELRTAWSIDRSLVIGLSAELSTSKRLTIYVHITNVSPVAWVIRGATIRADSLTIAYGIGILNEMALTDYNVNIDTGESTTVPLTCGVQIPEGVNLQSETVRWGVIITSNMGLKVTVEAPESPLEPSSIPVYGKSRLRDGSLWKEGDVRFSVRVVD